MSRMRELIADRLPAGFAVPDELDRAWAWMQERGHVVENANGYFLTPYAGTAQLGMVFTSTASLEGWFEPGSDGYDQLFPIAEIAGDGSLAVLWNDEGAVRVGALGSDGETFLLADSALDFVRLAAVGYEEIAFADDLDEPPYDEDGESVPAHADFRAWASTEFDVTVPEHWASSDPDPFAQWVAPRLG